MTLVYSIYAFVTNLIASGKYDPGTNEVDTSADVLSISLGSKQVNKTDENENYYYIQCWIGVGMVVIWTLMLFVLKYLEKEQEVRVDQETISPADFSIVLDGVPTDATQE